MASWPKNNENGRTLSEISKSLNGHYTKDNKKEIENVEKQIDNERALPKEADTYQLETFEKNILLIFNHKDIDGCNPRRGTNEDVSALKNTFEKYNFEVTEYKDLTKKEVFKTLDELSAWDFTDYGCIGIAVLTHGTDYGMLHAKDQTYSEMEIINYFKADDKPTLKTKPKLLIIEACRGKQMVPSAKTVRSKTEADNGTSDKPYFLPAEVDILILHSSFVDTPSYRHIEQGSWFIQSLCKKIDSLGATHDLVSIVLEVTRDVVLEKELEVYNQTTSKMQVCKQTPEMTSTLMRKLYFKKFGESSEIAPIRRVRKPNTSQEIIFEYNYNNNYT